MKKYKIMQLKHIGKNQTLLQTKNKLIFFSYQEPVVVEYERNIYVTDQKFSKTTSGHINKYLDGRKAQKIDHEQLLIIASTKN